MGVMSVRLFQWLRKLFHTLASKEAPVWMIARHERFLGKSWTRNVIRGLEATGLGKAVEAPWRTHLTRNNRFLELVAWSERRMLATQHHPSWVASHIESHIAARRFDDAKNAYSALSSRAFSDPRLGKGDFTRLRVAESIIAFETSKDNLAPMAALPFNAGLIEHIYRRMWDSHALLDAGKVEFYANLYLEYYDYKTDFVLDIYRKFLVPNGLLIAARQFISLSTSKKKQEAKQRKLQNDKTESYVLSPNTPEIDRRRLREELSALWSAAIEIDVELGGGAAADEIVALAEQGPGNGALARMAAQCLMNRGEFSEARALLESNIGTLRIRHGSIGSDGNLEIRETSRLLGAVYEMMRDFDAAIGAYRRSTEASTPQEWLGGAQWMLVSGLLHRGEVAEAGAVMRQQLAGFWKSFAGLSKKSPFKRIRRGPIIPEGNTVVLGGRGVGDEILRFMFLRSLRRPDARYFYTVEQRLKDLLQPANDWVEFITISRTVGLHAVSEEQYWRDRDGVPSRFDPNRVTAAVMEKIQTEPNLLVSEDIQVAALSMGKNFPAMAEPLVSLSSQERARARLWLDTLPGKIKVGISWRSGDRNFVRDMSYVRIEDCGALLAVPGVDFINLQYTDTSEERAQVLAEHNVEIHTMPGLDLRDDLRGIAALARECDIVIAPCTAVRELAGAAGAHVWSLTITPYLPDLWRIGSDGRHDLYFPNMIHFTAMEHGSSAGVLLAMAEELKARMRT